MKVWKMYTVVAALISLTSLSGVAQYALFAIRVAGPFPITIGEVLQNSPCSPTFCAVAYPGTGPISGIAATGGNPGDTIYMSIYGSASADFDNTPVLNDIAVANTSVGTLHDSGVTDLAAIPCTTFVSGRIIGINSPTSALTNILSPGDVGHLITPGCADATSWATFVKANQNTSIGPQGSTGAIGPPGNTGSAGAVGPQGIQGAVGAVGPVGAPGANGTAGATGSTGPQGTAGVLFYTSSGAVASPKCFWSGPTATTASGNWTVNFAPAGITTVEDVSVTPISPTGTASNQQYFSSVNTPTATTVSGTTSTGVFLLLLSNTINPLTTATSVYVKVCGK